MGPGTTDLELVTVGDPGNTGEVSGEWAGGDGPNRLCGGVDYTYRISKYETTNAQYTEFLNSVASLGDPHGLYHASMSDPFNFGGISRTGSGTAMDPYVYDAKNDDPEWKNRPVNFVNFWDACRFANWLHNGQPIGTQNASTTEDGAYTLNGYTGWDGRGIARNPDALFFVPSENEWYKAAYYDSLLNGGAGGYHQWPTGVGGVDNNPPSQDTGDSANFLYLGYAVGMPYYTTEAGAYALSGSSYDTYDQGGNVFNVSDFGNRCA